MNVAVELCFDSDSESRLRALWDSLELIYGSDHETEIGVRPHISLTAFSDGEPDFLSDEIQALANRFEPFELKLASVGSFPTAEGVVYLAPSPNERLDSIHTDFHAVLASHEEPGNPYYRPGTWVPHCTVATGVPSSLMDTVLEACRAEDVLQEVIVQGIGMTSYHPVKSLQMFSLIQKGVT